MDHEISKVDFLTEESTDRRRIFFKVAVVVLFWGALWGLIEATIGYGLHLLRIRGVTSFFLFPMACYYMEQVRKQTHSHVAILYMALLAAGIKLLDFLIPGHDPIRVIYPAIAMILEALAVLGAFEIAGKLNRKFGYPEALFACVSWRVVFTLFQFATLVPEKHPTPGKMVKFLLLDSLINSFLIYLYIKVAKPQEKKDGALFKHISPVSSVIVFVLAILSKWVIL